MYQLKKHPVEITSLLVSDSVFVKVNQSNYKYSDQTAMLSTLDPSELIRRIVRKKWEPRNLVPAFFGQNSKKYKIFIQKNFQKP